MSTPTRSFSLKEAHKIGEAIGIDWALSPFDAEQFRMGMDVELEHGRRDPRTNVTNDDPVMTGKIVLAHLNEFPDYYTRLVKMEQRPRVAAHDDAAPNTFRHLALFESPNWVVSPPGVGAMRRDRGDEMKKNMLFGAAIFGGLVAAYIRLIRPRQMHWGATPEEATRTLPYDDLVPDPTWNSTRVVTVEATPEQIWPWLVQVGWGRAGYYGYDLIDNGARPSAWEIVPEHQHLEKGTKFPMSPWTAMYCRDFEEPRWMLLRMGKDDGGASDIGSFLYYLEPIDERHTRLMIRMRDKYRWFNPPILAMQLAVDVGDIFFQWKHLQGVKARAERMARREAISPSRERYEVAP